MSVVALGATGIFSLLAMSGALGWVEAVTAAIVLLAGASAYFVGSTAPEPEEPPIATDAVEDSKKSAPDVETFLRALPFACIHIGAEGRIDAANAPARRAFRIPANPRSFAAAVIRQPELLAAIEAASRAPLRRSVEFEQSGSAGQFWRAHVATWPVQSAGVMIVFEDLTEARRAEQARADFLANASHELRTPLTSLAGFIETMRGPARDDKESWDRFLDIMFEQTERMRRLIADLLSLSRIEFSEHRPPDSNADLGLIFHGAVQALRPVARERGVKLHYFGPEEGLEAIAVADEIAQVAQNLISNAVKFSPKDATVRVSCGLERSLEGARSHAGRQWADADRMTLLAAPHADGVAAIWLRVEDDGPGIAREHLPRLGQRFYRVDASRGGDITGTGLGLAIVKHVMTRHRGGLIVESRSGRGSAFSVWLPANHDRR